MPNNNNNNNNNSLFILGNNVQLNQHKTKIKLLHIKKYIKPSYLGTDQYRVKTYVILENTKKEI